MPDGTEGYEGTPAGGFRAAENRILWTGDAGLGASLDDMIAWERHIDATRDDADALYSRLSAPVTFADGTPAGVRLRPEPGAANWAAPSPATAARCAAGAATGMYLPVGARLRRGHVQPPVDAHEAAVDLLAAVLGEDRPPPLRPAARCPTGSAPTSSRRPALSVRIDAIAGGPGTPALRPLPGTARPARRRHRERRRRAAAARRRRPVDGPPARKPELLLRPCDGDAPRTDVAGRYRCEELDAELTVTDAGGVLYGGFSGFLGQGRMELLSPVGADVWAAALPARARPHAARRLDAGLPPRRHRPDRRRRGRLLARPPPELHPHRLTVVVVTPQAASKYSARATWTNPALPRQTSGVIGDTTRSLIPGANR